jgi:eukaryotic-like serine/threonine-protein kinase
MVGPGSSESARREGAHPDGTSGEEGRIVGARYRILGQLGSGGMGAVYLCEHLVLGRRYAIKILQAGRALDAELVGRFRQEAQAASRIDQENVVQVVDFGEDQGGDLYYVMELLEGRTLAQLMREEGPLAVPRALALLEQVCRALVAAHARGVVHRDVKPDNVLVERLADGTERAKLIDFGISHLPATGRLTRAGEIIGTPEYMAPEQASGAEVDEQTDVYAVGVLGFELLTGTLPLLGSTPIATLVAHQTQPPPAPSTRRSALPPEVDALVLRALAKGKADRFATMQALAAEVTRVRVAASLASVARRTDGGEWSNETVGTGRGGTIGLAAVPYAEPPTGPAPILPAPEPAAGPASAPVLRPVWTVRRRALVLGLAALALGVLVAGSLVALLQGAPATTATSETPPASPPPPVPTSASPPTTTSSAPDESPPVAPPRRLEDDGPAATPRPAPRPPPSSREEPLRDPYATPGDPLKPDPFR